MTKMIQRAIFFRAFDLKAFAGVQHLLARYPGRRSVPGILCSGVFPPRQVPPASPPPAAAVARPPRCRRGLGRGAAPPARRWLRPPCAVMCAGPALRARLGGLAQRRVPGLRRTKGRREARPPEGEGRRCRW